MSEIYDVVVIGSGLAGIYFAYKYLIECNNIKKYVIVDQNNYIGGRILSKKFNNTNVNLGAGIIEEKYQELIKLIKFLGLELIGPIKSKYEHLLDNLTEEDAILFNNSLRQNYYTNKEYIDEKNLTFSEFMEICYDSKNRSLWRNGCEFKDHYNSSVKSVIENYPYTDIITVNYEYYYLKEGWKKLLIELLKKINKFVNLNDDFDAYFDDLIMDKDLDFLEKSLNIALQHKVTKIIFGKNCKTVVFQNGRKIKTRGIAFCADSTIQNIELINLGNIENNRIIDNMRMAFDSVGSVPFVRIYTYHESIEMENNVKTNSCLSKIIKINNNILMLCYSEGEDYYKILELSQKLSQEDLIRTLYNIFKKNIPTSKISKPTSFIIKFWNVGVHYYKPGYNIPIKELRKKSIYLAGEMFSIRHGSTEGAILSVNECFEKNTIGNHI